MAGLCLAILALSSSAHARGLDQIRFQVVDPLTRLPISDAVVTVEDPSGKHAPQRLTATLLSHGLTEVFDTSQWRTPTTLLSGRSFYRPTMITIPAGAVITLQQNGPPITTIKIVVRAQLLQAPRNTTPATAEITHDKLINQIGTSGNLTKAAQGTPGATSDSNGQLHVRGEHTDITYVVDGIPLPDTLSGRQGSVVVPAIIDNLAILTGSYAPEYGGQTAAILDITTIRSVKKDRADITVQGGSYDTMNGDITAEGPIGKYAGYVFDFNASRTRNAEEPQQPDDQTAHNTGASVGYFSRLRFAPSRRDDLALTMSVNPDSLQISNRTGLSNAFASVGQGFGFLGRRNANGVRPDATDQTTGLLGAQPVLLPSQQSAGQDITQREVSEFATLAWTRTFGKRDTATFSTTVLHSGQDVRNHNPGVDFLNLPVDNSIEYNPTASRNVHHVQFTGTLDSERGSHRYKTGVVFDDQNGDESYNIQPASQLALDELAALGPGLVPAGGIQKDAAGKAIVDINGNPVYVASSRTSPTLAVHRSGFYRALYVQDTWKASSRFTFNYGLRGDWYRQTQTLGQPIVDTIYVSPRLNFAYELNRATSLRWSYNRLFNTPPLAQGAIVGQPIEPEVLNQYDISVEHRVTRYQTAKLAYYVKDIRNQVDVGLLIPGSQIGLYSGVNFQYGGIHGIEFSYDITPPKNVGFGSYINYTYSIARPNGVDNTGAPVPDFNDHDQRNTVGFGVSYNWKSGANAELTLVHGSGLASSVIFQGGNRQPRTTMDFNLNTSPRFLHGKGALGLTIQNLLDDRTVINFQSAFSGTRFDQGRRVLLTLSGNF